MGHFRDNPIATCLCGGIDWLMLRLSHLPALLNQPLNTPGAFQIIRTGACRFIPGQRVRTRPPAHLQASSTFDENDSRGAHSKASTFRASETQPTGCGATCPVCTRSPTTSIMRLPWNGPTLQAPGLTTSAGLPRPECATMACSSTDAPSGVGPFGDNPMCGSIDWLRLRSTSTLSPRHQER